MSWAPFENDALSLRPSALESARFGISVSRLTVGWEADERLAAQFVSDALASSTVDLIIGRWPTRMLAIGVAIASSSRKIVNADVLVYWEGMPADVLMATRQAAEHTLQVTPATGRRSDEAKVVEEIVRDSFQTYGNHYRANPDLDAEAALDGYVEWAEHTLAEHPEDVLFLRDHGRPVGVATLTHNALADELEVELAGLMTASQGQGLYATLLRECAHTAQLRGCRRLLISTQVQNVRVQRTWARAGLIPFAALSTVHATSTSSVSAY